MPKISYQEPSETFNGRDSSRSGPDGQVCYHVQGRPLARRFVRPRNPQTPLQLFVRQIFKSASPAWNALSEDAKASWESPQAAIIRTDVSGHQYSVVGRNLFAESYMYNTLTARSTPTFGPNGVTFPFIASVDSIQRDADAGNVIVNFTPGSDYGLAFFYFTRPLSAGVRKPPKNAFRIAAKAGYGLISLSTFPTSITIPITQLYQPVSPGTNIGVRIKSMSETYLFGGPVTDAVLAVESI